jgi:26S proteasome regulatory subunit N1
MLSATASLGLVLLWDVDGGLTPIDKYLYSAEDYIKVSFACFCCKLLIYWSKCTLNYAARYST